MNNMKKLLALVLAVFMLISMAACNPSAGTTGNGTTSKPNNDQPTDPEKTKYTVTIKSAGDMGLEGINVQIFDGLEMVDVKQTDADGKAEFQLAKGIDYTIKLNKVKPGYKYDDSYSFSGTSALIVLTTELITGESMNGAEFGLGDVMYDFEITDVEGKTHKVSEILAEKKVLILNFFYTACGPCVSEVPYMEEAYQMFKDKVEILSVNSHGGSDETEAACAAFKAQYGLSFPVAKVPNGWASMIGTGYPTTYIIDRYGVVCLVETGALPSLRPWVGMMQYFTADDYKQKLCNSLDDIVSRVEPTEEDETPEDLAATLGNADGNIVFSNEVEDQYCWPFIITDKDGVPCVKASNTGNEATYSILYANVTLKKGQAIAFDYLISSELNADILHVIVDETPILTISGVDDVPTWKTAYAWVAQEDGTYEVGITYMKDDSDNVGEDTAYIKNFRILDNLDEIDVPTFLPMNAATSDDGFTYKYVDIFYNEKDHYYHVGSVDGPLLLANLLGVTQLYEENSVYLMALDGAFVKDGKNYLDDMTPYASYASNGLLEAYCTVDKGLADLLKICVGIQGFDGTENEWLKLCRYYAAYGTDEQLEDPIKGLATFSAFEAKLGDDNVLSYDGRALMPRGKLSAFTPTESGVYRITTRLEMDLNIVGFIFPDTEYHHSNVPEKDIFTHEPDERMYGSPNGNISMVYYMEAGRTYYIDIALGDVYGVGDIPFTIEYLGAKYDIFRLCSQAYFTAAEAGGDIDIGNLIAGGVDVVLGEDGYYYHDLGKDANGNQRYGSKIYAEFTGITALINTPIMDYTYIDEKTGEEKTIKGLVTLGAFDFSKDENDQYLDTICKNLGTKDRAAVEEYLANAWGELYAEKVVEYRLDDYFNGIYHGTGKDETEAIKAYFAKVITEEGDMQGTVAVDEELARLLHLIVSKYSFEDVDYSWKKLCYYWDYMGTN